MKGLIAGTALALCLAGPAGATVYTQTWTGTVTSGTDVGNYFGGGNLAGKSFTSVYVFDDSIGLGSSNVYYHQSYGGTDYATATPNVLAKITINGTTFSFVATTFAYFYATNANGYSQAYSDARLGNNQLVNNVYQNGAPQAYGDPSFSVSATIPSTASGWSAFSFGNTYLSLKNLTYSATLGDASAPVPEAATWAMFIGGFGLIGGAMRRRRTAVSFA